MPDVYRFGRQLEKCPYVYCDTGHFLASEAEIPNDDLFVKFIKKYLKKLKREKCNGCGVSVSKHHICVIGFFGAQSRVVYVWPGIQESKAYLQKTVGEMSGLKIRVLKV